VVVTPRRGIGVVTVAGTRSSGSRSRSSGVGVPLCGRVVIIKCDTHTHREGVAGQKPPVYVRGHGGQVTDWEESQVLAVFSR